MQSSAKTEEFITKPKKNIDRVKHNSLFNYITMFPEEVNDLVKPRHIEPIASNRAYLIDFEVNNHEIVSLFPTKDGYVLGNRHLRLDELYEHMHTGFTSFHYTEIYENKTLASKIVVHAYFNSAGTYTHTQIKQQNFLSREETILDPSTIDLPNLHSNFKDAKSLLGTMLHNKNQLYIRSVNNSYQLGKQLDRLSKDISTVPGKMNYINKANEFITCINLLNSLNEVSYDSRGKSVHKLIAAFLNNTFTPDNNLCTTDDTSSEEDYAVVAITYTEQDHTCSMQTSNTDQPTAQEIFQILKSKAKKYKKTVCSFTNSNDIVANCRALDKLLLDMQLTLLEMHDFPAKKYQTKQRMIGELEKAINYAQTFIQNCLVSAMNDGEIDTLKAIFSVGKNHLSISSMSDFVENLRKYEINSKEIEQKMITLVEIIDFLYNNSDVFKSVLNLRMQVCAWESEEDIAVQFLYEIYLKRNLSFFKKCIAYGACRDYGMISRVDNRAIPLINLIVQVAVVDSTVFEYVDALISKGVPLISGRDLSRNMVQTDYIVNEDKVKKTSTKKVKVNGRPNELTKIIDKLYDLTPLEIATSDISIVNHVLIEKLLPHSCAKSLALSLSACANDRNVRTMFCVSSTHNGVYCCAQEEKGTLFSKFFASHNADRILYYLSIVPVRENLFIESKTTLQIVCDALQAKFKQLNNPYALIDTHIKQILTDSKEVKMGSSASYKWIQLEACLFLLAWKSKLDLKDTKLALSLLKRIATVGQNKTQLIKLLTDSSKFCSELTGNKQEAQLITTQFTAQQIARSKTALLLKLATALNAESIEECILNPIYDQIDIDTCLPGNKQQTVLHYACTRNSYECAKKLILLGASITSVDANGNTPLDLLSNDDIKNALIELDKLYTDTYESDETKTFANVWVNIEAIENKYFGNTEDENLDADLQVEKFTL